MGCNDGVHALTKKFKNDSSRNAMNVGSGTKEGAGDEEDAAAAFNTHAKTWVGVERTQK